MTAHHTSPSKPNMKILHALDEIQDQQLTEGKLNALTAGAEIVRRELVAR